MSCDNYPSKKDVEDFALNAKVINEFTTESGELTTSAASDGKQKITLAEIWRQANEESVTSSFMHDYVQSYTWMPWSAGDEAEVGKVYRYVWGSGHASFFRATESAVMGGTPDYSKFELREGAYDVKDFGAYADGVNDDTAALQFAISVVSVKWSSAWYQDSKSTLNIDGDFLVSSTISIPFNIIITGNFTLKASTMFAGDSMITASNRIMMLGASSFVGNGDVKHAIKANNFGRSVFSSLNFDNFADFALLSEGFGNSNHVRVTVNGAARCGRSGVVSYTAVNSGSGIVQKSLVTTSERLPDGALYIAVDGVFHQVLTAIGDTFEVFPQLPTEVGDLTYYAGGVISTSHNDANAWYIGVDAVGCAGIVVRCSALYGHAMESFSAEGCGIGVSFGVAPSAPVINAVLNMPYFEGNDADTLLCASNSYVTIIEPMHSLDGFKKLLYADNGYTIIRQCSVVTPNIHVYDRGVLLTAQNSYPRYVYENAVGKVRNAEIQIKKPLVDSAGVVTIYTKNFSESVVNLYAPEGYTINGLALYTVEKSATPLKIELVLVGSDYYVYVFPTV